MPDMASRTWWSSEPSHPAPTISVRPTHTTTRTARTTSLGVRGTGGALGERFGGQVVQLLGAAEHRSARIDRFVSEERRPQQRRWAAWAPKIRRGSPVGPL